MLCNNCIAANHEKELILRSKSQNVYIIVHNNKLFSPSSSLSYDHNGLPTLGKTAIVW